MESLVDALAGYVGALEASADSTNQAEDRPKYTRHLAEAARMLRAAHCGSLDQLKAIVDNERRSYGWDYLSGEAGRSAEAAWVALASQVEAGRSPTARGSAPHAMGYRREADRWSTEAPSVMAPERLHAIREALEQSAIIVEHRFYRGSRSPERMVFDDHDDFREYLRTTALRGDSFWFWCYDELCRDDNAFTQGKFPDTDGMVPSGGAY